jgi:hypothetical protein
MVSIQTCFELCCGSAHIMFLCVVRLCVCVGTARQSQCALGLWGLMPMYIGNIGTTLAVERLEASRLEQTSRTHCRLHEPSRNVPSRFLPHAQPNFWIRAPFLSEIPLRIVAPSSFQMWGRLTQGVSREGQGTKSHDRLGMPLQGAWTDMGMLLDGFRSPLSCCFELVLLPISQVSGFMQTCILTKPNYGIPGGKSHATAGQVKGSIEPSTLGGTHWQSGHLF